MTGVEQNGGGWAPIVFHQICNGCDPNSITLTDFTAFLDWLQQRGANGTVVQTVQQVVGGAVHSAVPGPRLPPPPNGRTRSATPRSSRTATSNRYPTAGRSTTSATQLLLEPERRTPTRAAKAERVDVANYTSGDSKLIVDAGHGLLHSVRDPWPPLPDHGLVQVRRAGPLHGVQARWTRDVLLLGHAARRSRRPRPGLRRAG